MENGKPLLSICIPTYNRSQYLKKTLKSIVTQKEFLEGTVEIVVSDNASTDATERVVKEYTKRFSNIFYSKNEVNIRDKNFPIVLSKAHGTLRRLCNDTLIFQPGALDNMCTIIRENRKERPFMFWSNGSSKDHNDIQRTDFNGFVHKISFYITSIACFSIWDHQCEGIDNDFSGCELLLWQVHKGLEIANQQNDVLIFNKHLADVQVVSKKDISYGLYSIFYVNYFKLLEPYFINGSLPVSEKDYLEKDLLFNFFATWCAKWEMQTDNLNYSPAENLKSAIWKQYKGKPYWSEFLLKYCFRLIIMKVKKTIKINTDRR